MKKKFLLLCVLLVILLVGCGTATHADTKSTTKSTRTVTLPDTLEVVSLCGSFEKTITDQASVHSFYNAMYALPHVREIDPKWLGVGPQTCGYHLQFFVHHRLLEQVNLLTISLNGLELAPHDHRMLTDQFWSLFAQTVHEPLDKLTGSRKL